MSNVAKGILVCETYMRRSRCSDFIAAQHLQYVILGVRGQRVSARIDGDVRTTGNVIIKFHVSRLRLVKLHVPISVRRNLFGHSLPQRDLRECRSFRWERLRRKRSCT